MFKTGSKYETKENSGISHFLEHMFFMASYIFMPPT
ncbi:MAG: insulinase family protein [Patescibacteria group bacterium]